MKYLKKSPSRCGLKFIELDPTHKGVVISKDIFDCVTEWKLDDKITSITLDNASSNDCSKELDDKVHY